MLVKFGELTFGKLWDGFEKSLYSMIKYMINHGIQFKTSSDDFYVTLIPLNQSQQLFDKLVKVRANIVK
jgi:hypothetical protein